MFLCRPPDYGDGGAIVCKAAGTIAPDNPAAMFLIMTDLMQIISNGQANVRLEITGEDLHNYLYVRIIDANESKYKYQSFEGFILLTL